MITTHISLLLDFRKTIKIQILGRFLTLTFNLLIFIIFFSVLFKFFIFFTPGLYNVAFTSSMLCAFMVVDGAAVKSDSLVANFFCFKRKKKFFKCGEQ